MEFLCPHGKHDMSETLIGSILNLCIIISNAPLQLSFHELVNFFNAAFSTIHAYQATTCIMAHQMITNSQLMDFHELIVGGLVCM